MDSKDSNKRKYSRHEAGYFVSYKEEGKDSVYDRSRTKNLSQGGMMITTGKKFEKGTKLQMKLNFPLIHETIDIIGIVVNSKEKVKDSIYETRVEYADVDKDFFQKLGEFIDRNSKA